MARDFCNERRIRKMGEILKVFGRGENVRK